MTINDALPDDIDMTKLADVEIVKTTNDPALWHEGAVAALAYLGDKHGFLPWLVQQPNMDRATAGWLLFWTQGSRYLRGEKDSFYARISDSEVVSLLNALCERSARIGFPQDQLGLEQDFDKERKACLDVVANGQVAAGTSVPHAIIDRPFQPEKGSGNYENHDGILVNKRLFASIFR